MITYKPLALLYRERAEKYQSRIALRFKNRPKETWQAITWNELIEKIDASANAMIAKKVALFENVGIFSRNMPEWTIADLALMSIRAVSIPLYATDAASQVEYIVKETEMKMIFVGENEQYQTLLEVSSRLNTPIQIIVFDAEVNLMGNPHATYFSDFLEFGREQSKEELQKRLSSQNLDDLLTIIYTSGTSGEPKGVMLKQRNFLNTFKMHDAFLTISEDDVSLAFLPFSHVFERTWTLMALHRGMTNYYLRNPKAVVETMKEVKPTIMCAVPRFFEKTYGAVFEQVEAYSPAKKALFLWAVKIGEGVMECNRTRQPIPWLKKIQFNIADALVLKKGRAVFGGNIRFMPCGGAALSDEINRFFQSVGIHIKYAYGLTETIATVSVFGDQGFKFGTVGKPLKGIQLRIGENNEIQIKGDSVFEGYFKKPHETQLVFEDGYFKTGDAGAIDSDGFLIMTERIKDLIKTSSGKFVAPQMVEMKLIADPYIEQAVVIGDNRKYCVALIIPSFPLLEKFAVSKYISYSNFEELVRNPEIFQFYEQRIYKILIDLADYQKIKKFFLLPSDFTILSGEYTPTLKTRRKFIEEKYRLEISKLYSE